MEKGGADMPEQVIIAGSGEYQKRDCNGVVACGGTETPEPIHAIQAHSIPFTIPYARVLTAVVPSHFITSSHGKSCFFPFFLYLFSVSLLCSALLCSVLFCSVFIVLF